MAHHAPRPRRYVPQLTLMLVRPLFRYSPSRDAHVLRVIGNSRGPVLRQERRHGQLDHAGPERRRVAVR